jgi:hypothetical protein
MLSKHIHQLQPDRITKRLRDLGHPNRVVGLNVRIHERLAAPLARRTLLLGRKL